MRIVKRLADARCASEIRIVNKMWEQVATMTGYDREAMLAQINVIEARLFRTCGYKGEMYYAANHDERI